MGVKLKGNIRIKTTKKTGDFLVRFFDYDGTILKEQWVYSGETATAPPIPTHQYLTFAEWNNTFDNVTEDIDTGAIYNTTDGKTYLFITLNAVTGLAPTLYFRKTTTSLMTINWGDGQTSTSTTATTNLSIQHTYASYGDYVVTIDNSLGGSFYLGDSNNINQPLGTTTYRGALTKYYFGANNTFVANYFLNYSSLEKVSFGKDIIVNAFGAFQGCNNLHAAVLPANLTLTSSTFNGCYNLKYVIFPPTFTSSNFVDSFLSCTSRMYTKTNNTTTTIGSNYSANNFSIEKQVVKSTVTSIGNSAFSNNYNCCCYLVYPTTPPTLGTTIFNNINSLAKIYVPDAVVDTYKAATGWIAYANYIYPLSTYIPN